MSSLEGLANRFLSAQDDGDADDTGTTPAKRGRGKSGNGDRSVSFDASVTVAADGTITIHPMRGGS